MKFSFTNEEVAVLFTHLNLMKKSIKKGFKKSYVADWKEKYDHYLGLIEILENMIKAQKLEKDFDVCFAAEHFTMLHSFINWYVNELNRKENNKDKINHDVIKLLAILEGIQEKINKLAA
ncbi:hypothetical protein ACNQFZ_06555 [Schinkia sp. CFF1]